LVNHFLYTFFLTLTFALKLQNAQAQRDLIKQGTQRIGRISKSSGGASTDSLVRRDRFEDSISIHFTYLDSVETIAIDTTINDYNRHFPLPSKYLFLSNSGSAAKSLVFEPDLQIGFRPGPNGLDIYKWTLEDVAYFHTTRPYTQLRYTIASRAEQLIELIHTQNIKPNWNFMYHQRLLNAPGHFKNETNNHNNHVFSSHFQSVNKRYQTYLAIIYNKLIAGENGGIPISTDLDNPDYDDRFNIFTQLGGQTQYNTSFLNPEINTATRQNELLINWRNQYDFGKKDSLVSDSTVIPLFYPKIRLEHTVMYKTLKTSFTDNNADSKYYEPFYPAVEIKDTIKFSDRWKILRNDFSIYQFPDNKNIRQFLKVGVAIENISLTNTVGNPNFVTTSGHFTYKNRTRNKLWDLSANATLYFTGLYAGNYTAQAFLKRAIYKKEVFLTLDFQNINRSPSFTYDARSEFYFLTTPSNFKDENIVKAQATIDVAKWKTSLQGAYYSVLNYLYITAYDTLNQQGSLFNALVFSAFNTFPITKKLVWHSELYFQKTIGNAAVNLPLLFARTRIGYEGKLGLKNLRLATGLQMRYHTPYKADGYSPLLNQFFFQNDVQINNKLPDISAYFNFNIKNFTAFIQLQNLNTLSVKNGVKFTNNNQPAPLYYYPGLMLRASIHWTFVN